jgi:hypothetical protein
MKKYIILMCVFCFGLAAFTGCDLFSSLRHLRNYTFVEWQCDDTGSFFYVHDIATIGEGQIVIDGKEINAVFDIWISRSTVFLYVQNEDGSYEDRYSISFRATYKNGKIISSPQIEINGELHEFPVMMFVPTPIERE